MSEGEIKSSWAAVQDHTRHFSDFTFVYPVISRRSQGLSIGINLNPDKVCNFDCIYCEVDRSTPGTRTEVDLNQMREELLALVQFVKDGGLAREPKFDEVGDLAREVKDIAFSGDGEPTMINNFSECVESVAEVKRHEGLSETKMVLITDAAGLDKTDVKHGLSILDSHNGEIWAKLDAGSERYYKAVNRSSVKFERVLCNLLETARERPIIIQSLFLRAHGKAMSEQELKAFCGRLNDITSGGGRIQEVHLYTIARPTPEDFAAKLETEELEAFAQKIRKETDIEVAVFP